MSKRKRLPKKCNLNNPDFTWILGSIYGDGHINKTRIELSSKDLDFIEEFEERMEKIGFNNCKRHDHLNLFRIICNSTNLSEYIKDIQIDDLYKISKECKKTFVLGFFNAEGHVACKIYNSHQQSRNLTISNCDEKLILLVKTFLKDFGIKSNISTSLTRPIYLKYVNDSYSNGKKLPTKKYLHRLIICSKNNFKKFYDLGKLISRKENEMNVLLSSYKPPTKTRHLNGQFKFGHKYFGGRWK